MKENTHELPKSYEARKIESTWYPKWIGAGLFTPKASRVMSGAPSKKPYVIMMPPPNVTSSLHNGHALTMTLQDILVRFHRMLGEEALWLPGTDHAGIATQAIVERELLKNEGKTRHDLGRSEFLKRVWLFKEKNGDRIIEQLKTMGVSADWTRCRFTMDEQCTSAVQEAFVRLWNDGLIYRGERLVSWDPQLQTALSDEEVDHVDREGELWRFAYKIVGSEDEIIVATTRPETMLGDVAVAVHPGDERYRRHVGSLAVHPFFADRQIKIIADSAVDPKFGTGAVKITPAHDANDFAMGNRHGLEKINIFTLDAHVNENGGIYQGLDRYEARKKIKVDLEEQGYFRGTEKIQHAVSTSQRSGADIEPMLSRQYFVNAKPLAKLALDAVATGETEIIPENWRKTWDHFLVNIQDWCVSRQLWWGHQIPVFYDVEKMRVAIIDDAKERGIQTKSAELLQAKAPVSVVLKQALAELPEQRVRSFSVASVENLSEKHGDQFLQEEDVLDTWFSSGLWPFSTLGWPDNSDDLKAFYPSSVLETGFDILFFWVARMMMFGIYFMGRPPFKDVYLHAMVRDSQGRKMSKSLGNAIDPVDVIEGISLEDLLAKTKSYPVPPKLLGPILDSIKKEYPEGIAAAGADGLRLSLAMLAGQGRDVKLAIPRVAGYRAFLNKVWNATRFGLMRIGGDQIRQMAEVKGYLEPEDRWILSRLQGLIAKTNENLLRYRFSDTADGIYQFFWTEFCDWYLELVKPRLEESANAQSRQAAGTVIVELLDQSMRLFHPICPFISEEIWQLLPTRDSKWKPVGVEFCAVAPYPVFDAGLVDDEAEREIGFLQQVVVALRNAKQESNLPAQKKTPAIILTDDVHLPLLQKYKGVIARLAIIDEPRIARFGDVAIPAMSAVNASAQFEVAIPLSGLLDVNAEKERLNKDLQKIEKEMSGISGRLDNAGFVSKAPPEVIDEHKKQLLELEKRKERIVTSLKRFDLASA